LRNSRSRKLFGTINRIRLSQKRSHKIIRRLSIAAPDWFMWRAVQMALDGCVAASAVLFAYLLRFDFSVPQPEVWRMFAWMAVFAVERPILLLITRHYLATWRHFHLRDVLQLAAVSSAFTLLLASFRGLSGVFGWRHPIPYSVLVLELGIFLVLACSMRMARRLIYEGGRSDSAVQLKTVVVGNDRTFASALKHVRSFSDVSILGLISEEERLVGYSISGYFVLGTPAALPRILAANAVALVIIAGADQDCVSEVVAIASEYGAQLRILPSAKDLISGDVRINRKVSIEQIAPKRNGNGINPGAAHPDVQWSFRNRSVLVTGAGGSIGSEICRQAVRLQIRELILLDQDENSIFELVNQLPSSGVKIVPLVGDIRDRATVSNVFASHHPNIVLHAAAYKHVPIMECNPCEAVLNNVLGTRQLVEAAVAHSCERFVMISTDKAVRPSSVMGATKRVAELLVQMRAANQMDDGTQFACVRFGNVMGSRGSVLPIFMRQIAAGEPITITHEEMTRYFMTIPQAVQLVLQAATLASTGDIYMLDMGDPVKIIEMAKELIRMAGLKPEVDIPINIVGTRPGEKLHEQLWREDAIVEDTSFPFVHRVMAFPTLEDFPMLLDELEDRAIRRSRDEEITALLEQMPLDYRSEPVPQMVAAG